MYLWEQLRRKPIAGEDEDAITRIARLLGLSGSPQPAPQVNSRALSVPSTPMWGGESIPAPEMSGGITSEALQRILRQVPIESVQQHAPALSVPTSPPLVEPVRPTVPARSRIAVPVDMQPEGNIVPPAPGRLPALRIIDVEEPSTINSPVSPAPTRAVNVNSNELKRVGTPPGVRPELTDTGDRMGDLTRYERELEAFPVKDRNGRWVSVGLGALRGFAQGGLGGALFGAASHAVRPSLDEDFARTRNLQGVGGQINTEFGRRKALGDLDAQAANTEWVRQRPVLEETKEARRAKYDEWRMSSGDRKLDTVEKYIQWRMSNGDRRATTAEGQLELRQEWQEFNKDATTRRLDQGGTRITETARHNEAVERALGDYRRETLGLSRERNQISREGIAARGGRSSTSPTVDRAALGRARAIAEKAERFKQAAISEPDETKRAEYLRAARTEAATLAAQYPDLFEVGEGEGGWPYVKAKSGGGKTATQADIDAYIKHAAEKNIVVTPEDARRKFEAEGWSVR